MSSETGATVKGQDANPPLKSLGKYLIERKLGQGGMGTVYLAKHTDLKKMIALKVLPQDKAKNPILVRRFKAEAQAAAQLEHPNIVAVYDTGEADGYLYIAMEYVDGIDLFEQVKRRGVIPVKRSIEIIKQVTAALQHAYEQNIVHRDIKPSNLLLRQDGTVKVTDLGLARSIDDTLETNITRAGTTVGTVDYMAPEQARNSKAADIRSDIYSLGCTWYQMLTGEPPFPDGSLTNKLQAHAIKPLPDPREKNENIPEGLIAVLQRMTAKKPDDRYQSPAELLDDLEHSKLTKAAFSNEIFSDLSDHEVDTTGLHNQTDADESPESYDDPVSEEPTPRRRPRSRVEEDDEEAPHEPTRRRSRVFDNDDDNEQEQLEDPPETTRRKPRSQPAETEQEEDTQPSRPRQKTSHKSYDEEPEEEEPRPSKRSSKRPSSIADEDEVEEPSSKRRRVAAEDKSSPKNGKAPSAPSDKKPKFTPKPLPPKRQAAPSNAEDEKKGNLELLKYGGIIAGILTVVVGLGWLISRWANQVDSSKSPFANQETQTTTVVAPAQPVPVITDPPESNSVTINVVDPLKQSTTERPVIEYEIAKQPMPPWAVPDAAEPRDLPIFTVGPGTTTATHFSNLDDALKAADKGGGGLIRLLGNGPYVASALELNNARRLVLSAATSQDQPVIVFKVAENGACGLTLNRGVLDLRGLNLTIDRIASPIAAASAMVSVNEGQLFVRNCTFTATGNDAPKAIAMNFGSREDSQNIPATEPQLLLDRVTIRGNGLTGLQVQRAISDIVIQDSLFVTGTAPAIDLSGSLIPAMADVMMPKPRRTIRVLRSTLCARQRVLEFAAEKGVKPPSTALLFQDSICTAEGSGNMAVLLAADRWPSASTSTTAGWLTNLTWTSVSSLYMGFERLIDLDKSYKVENLDAWQRVWGKKFEAAQFQRIVWQEAVIPDLASVLPYDFDNARLPYHDIKSSTGSLPGCPVNRLKAPGMTSAARMAAMNQRPKLPAAVLKPADPIQTKKVDAMKEDLGLILNKADWQSGTVFEVSGSGLRFMTPAKINGRSLRIVFNQVDGSPLKLQPKVPEQKAKPDQQALINIENAQLDLQAVMLESAQTVKGAAPPWLINSKNATIILRGCQLSGPLQQDLEQHQGLIQWITTGSGPASATAEPPFLSINDSLLLSTGVGIRAECTLGQIFMRNSVLAVRGNGLSILPMRTDTRLLPAVDLEHVTFSASKAAIRFEAAPGAEPVTSPLKAYVEFCAVVAPPEVKAGETADATAVECTGPVLEKNQLEWWGTSNGIAREVKTLLRQSDAESITAVPHWQKTWGSSNDVRLLTGAKGVQLSNPLPNKWVNLKPTSFSLDLDCLGSTWADGARPVGAESRIIDDALIGKKAVRDAKPNTPTSPNSAVQSGQPAQVGTKKNAGF